MTLTATDWPDHTIRKDWFDFSFNQMLRSGGIRSTTTNYRHVRLTIDCIPKIGCFSFRFLVYILGWVRIIGDKFVSFLNTPERMTNSSDSGVSAAYLFVLAMKKNTTGCDFLLVISGQRHYRHSGCQFPSPDEAYSFSQLNTLIGRESKRNWRRAFILPALLPPSD